MYRWFADVRLGFNGREGSGDGGREIFGLLG